MRRSWTHVVACAVALLVTAPASAQAIERISASDHERGYPKGTAVVLVSPASYDRDVIGGFGDDGTWKGPPYASTIAGLGDDSSMDWDVSFDERSGSAEQAILEGLQGLVQDWPEIERRTVAVPWRSGNRDRGTLAGLLVLTRAPAMAGDARYEAALAFRIPGYPFIIVRFVTFQPSSDSAGGAMGFGDYVIEGVAPSVWNRQQIDLAVPGVSIESVLPPRRVTARASGGRVLGTVLDSLGEAVAGARVTLQEQIRGAWKKVRTGRTDAEGDYALRGTGAGRYRVLAALAGGSARSRVVRLS